MSSSSYVRYDFIACLTWHIYCPLEQHRLNINCIKKSLWPYLAYLIFRKSQNLFINFLAFFRYIIQTTRFCITALICYEIASSLKSIKKKQTIYQAYRYFQPLLYFKYSKAISVFRLPLPKYEWKCFWWHNINSK